MVFVAIFLAAAIAVAREYQAGGAPGGSKLPPMMLGEGPRRPTGTGVISGVVRDGHTGQPIAGALVYVGISGRGPVGSMSRQITDPKGRFVFTDLPESDSFSSTSARPATTRVLARIHVAGLPQLAAGVTVRTDESDERRVSHCQRTTWSVSGHCARRERARLASDGGVRRRHASAAGRRRHSGPVGRSGC
jgi:hypothetical protein